MHKTHISLCSVRTHVDSDMTIPHIRTTPPIHIISAMTNHSSTMSR